MSCKGRLAASDHCIIEIIELQYWTKGYIRLRGM